jgi:lipid-binding SYLF domain-containing protein
MTKMYCLPALAFIASTILLGNDSRGQLREAETVDIASAVLNEVMSGPLKGIPASMLVDAKGVAVIPNVIKGSFVIGARHGKGVLVVRDENRNWHAPMFITLTGGNIGWQVGIQATDVILVFKTQRSIDGILSGKLTLGADAAVAAGPLGREATAATDERLKAEIYSYSRSRGLFAGVSFDGSVIQVDHFSDAAYYRSPAPGQPPAVPENAVKFVNQIAAYCRGAAPQAAAAQPQQPTLVPQHSTGGADALRDQLAKVAPALYEMLDPQWGAYLALPGEVFTGKGHPTPEMLNRCLAHFDAVVTDPRYRTLAQRPEFQSTYGLLKHYISARLQASAPLELPPPPADTP